VKGKYLIIYHAMLISSVLVFNNECLNLWL